VPVILEASMLKLKYATTFLASEDILAAMAFVETDCDTILPAERILEVSALNPKPVVASLEIPNRPYVLEAIALKLTDCAIVLESANNLEEKTFAESD
jgi:hypothetical protein